MTSVAVSFKDAKPHIDQLARSIKTRNTENLDSLNIGQIMSEFRYFLDTKEAIEDIVKSISKSIEEIKRNMIDRAAVEGINKFTSDDLTVSVSELDKIRIFGDWQQIQAQLIDMGYGFAVQRRITDKHITEAFFSGNLRLPDGIELVGVRQTNQRRK